MNRSTIIFGALPDDEGVDPMALAKTGQLEPWLKARLPALLAEFQKTVESIGFTF